MSTVHYRFIEPLDVLFLRGNQLFGDAGSYGESLIPPRPSVAAGAIRSRMLADEKIDLAAFGGSNIAHPTLGTPQNPGSFLLATFQVARRQQDGSTECLMAPPADLIISKTYEEALDIRLLNPTAVHSELSSSFTLPLLPILAQNERGKASGGYWLTQQGWQRYVAGLAPLNDHLLPSSDLWAFDARVGIGMSAITRSAEDGKLFSAQAVVMQNGVGFLAGVNGAVPPTDGLLRLGGDGRAAAIHATATTLPESDYVAICKTKRCRLVLTAPGLFKEGWKLPGTDSNNRVSIGGIQARLVCSAVPRAETISGWDLAKSQPKAAQKVAPTGSVYWLDELHATPEQLRKLAEAGLWQSPCEDAARRAEGFNRFQLAAWQTA
jgi:CRISPR-associated protein Cmr3